LTATDEQLMAEFQASRSADAIDELVARHLGTVRNLAYRMVLCNTVADDVTQDVFVKVMHHASSFRGSAKFSTWLYRIAVNTAKEHLRRRRVKLDLSENDGHAASPDHERPEKQVIQDELARKIEHAMAQLSPKLRAAVVLLSMERLTAKEAAAIEGCSVATMHWRIHHARKQLKQLLQGYLQS
jgi:RNA polymerase sigma-70 factor (ECF subfamily)